MTKRKVSVITTAIAIALIVGLLAISTAYFSATSKATNIITTGEISMILHDETIDYGNPDEPDAEPTLIPFPEDGIHGLLPGATVDKLVYVENDSDIDEYIRVYLTKTIEAGEGIDAELNFDGITLDINDTDWTLGEDGWYYYTAGIVHPGEFTEKLFTTVSFDPWLGNEYQNAHIEIVVHAQAVQAAHNGDSALTAQGWPAADFLD